MGNGPTEDQAEIIQHDQLSQHSESDEHEVRNQDAPSLHSVGLAHTKYVTRVVYYNVGQRLNSASHWTLPRWNNLE